VNEPSANHEQQVVDARMEYELLVKTTENLANMMWLGYGAYFAINTLLATALAFSYAPNSADSYLLRTVRIGIPVVGIAIAIIAMRTALEITKHRHAAIERGQELESVLFARIFFRLKTQSAKWPTATIVGAALFLVIWLGCLLRAN